MTFQEFYAQRYKCLVPKFKMGGGTHTLYTFVHVHTHTHTHTFTHTCTLTRKYTFSLSLSYTHTTFSHLKACLCSISLYRYLLSVDNHLDYPVPDLLADIVPSEGNQVKDASMVSTYHV